MLTPQRTDTNIRYYTDAELRYILNVSLLNQNGFKISKIATLTQDEIEREVTRITNAKSDYESQISALVLAMIDLDEFAFIKVFNDSTIRLGFENTIVQIVFPFLEKIGNLWVCGSIRPIHEHFISNLIRQKLIVNIHAHPKQLKPNAKRFVLFTPENELHEIALLFMYYILKSRQHDVIYLGLNIPMYDLVSVFNIHQPDYLICNITIVPKGGTIKNYVETLANHFQQSKIVVSGYQMKQLKGDLPENILQHTSITSFIEYVQQI
jgi:DNA-binding transcriptional MerR regulator